MLYFTDPEQPAALNRWESLLHYLQNPLVRPAPLTTEERASMDRDELAAWNRARIDYLSAGIVLTTTTVQQGKLLLTRAFQENRARNSGHAGVMLTGASTLGKTTTAKRLLRWVMEEYVAQFPHWRQFDQIPVAYVEVPANSTGKTLLKEFAGFLGLSVEPRESTSDIRVKVVTALRRAHTQLIVVDELHNLAGRGRGLGEAVDLLKGLHNDLSATFLYAGINVTDSSLMAGARGQQLAGRFSVLELDRYQWSNTAHRREWKALIRAFESELLLADHPARSLDPLAEYLHQRTGGAIGPLGRLLTATAIDLIANGKPEVLQQGDLDGYRLDHTSETHYKNVLSRKAKRASKATDELVVHF